MPNNTLARWKPVYGYEGLYEISDHGQVRSLSRDITINGEFTRSIDGVVLTPSVHRTGHLYVSLYRDGHRRTGRIHRLVAEAFIGPPPAGTECCHSNGDPADNRVANLRWDTRTANAQDSLLHGVFNGGVSLTHCRRGHEYSPTNLYVRPNGQRECRVCMSARAAAYRERKASQSS